MKAMKKASVLAATSALTLVLGLAAQPASAGWFGGGGGGPQLPSTDCCGVDWHFTGGDLTIEIDPNDLEFAALTNICADQDFTGFLHSAAIVADSISGGVTNAASSITNVISVGGTDGSASSFPAIVDAVQSVDGKLKSFAGVFDAVVTPGGDFSNAATSAANVVNISSTSLALLDATQEAGSYYHPIKLDATAIAKGVQVQGIGGDFENTASAIANVASVTVTPAVVQNGALNFNNSHHNNQPQTPNISATSLALVDVTQNAVGSFSSLAKSAHLNVAGTVNNAATSAANVINVINK
ncbi:MAG: hypothetical protein NVV74_12295 [Magnetospirillum sp.]|nr:hypothetical protein [Magnetospirillum sp.]